MKSYETGGRGQYRAPPPTPPALCNRPVSCKCHWAVYFFVIHRCSQYVFLCVRTHIDWCLFTCSDCHFLYAKMGEHSRCQLEGDRFKVTLDRELSFPVSDRQSVLIECTCFENGGKLTRTSGNKRKWMWSGFMKCWFYLTVLHNCFQFSVCPVYVFSNGSIRTLFTDKVYLFSF